MHRSILASVVALFLVGSASEAKIFSKWSVDEVGNYCIASTGAKVGSESYKLELSLEKSLKYPVEVSIRPGVANSPATAMVAPLDASGKLNYVFGKLIDAQNVETFWQIPRGTEKLIEYLRQGTKFSVKALLQPTPFNIVFSLEGSAAAIDFMEARCNKGKSFANREFEKLFLPVNSDKVTAENVTPQNTEAFRRSYIRGFNAYLAQLQFKAERAALDAKYSKQLKELKDVETNLSRLKGKDLADLNAKRATADQQRQTYESQLAQINSDLTTAQAELVTAKTELEAAQKAIAPFEQEFRQRLLALQSAQNLLQQTDSRLATIDRRLTQIQVDQSNLRSELSRLQNESSSLQSELSRANVDRQIAENNYNAFHEPTEVRDRLRQDWRYRNTQQRLGDVERAFRQNQFELQRAQQAERQAQQTLQNCQKKPGADCAAEKQAHQKAVNQRQKEQSEGQRLQAEKGNLEQDLRRIERRVQADVRDEKQRLLYILQQHDLRVAQLRSRMNEVNERMRVIVQVSLPSLDNEASSLRSESAHLQTQRPNQVAMVTQKQTELNDYKTSVGWDAKKATLDQAEDTFSAVSGRVNKLTADKSATEKKIIAVAKTISDLDAKIAVVQAEIQKQEVRLDQINTSLAAYQVEKDRLTNEAQKANQAFDDSKKEFGDNII